MKDENGTRNHVHVHVGFKQNVGTLTHTFFVPFSLFRTRDSLPPVFLPFRIYRVWACNVYVKNVGRLKKNGKTGTVIIEVENRRQLWKRRVTSTTTTATDDDDDDSNSKRKQKKWKVESVSLFSSRFALPFFFFRFRLSCRLPFYFSSHSQ